MLYFFGGFMQDLEILEKFEKLPISRRAAILRKYQEEIACKEDLSLQTLIDYLALNCVLANDKLPANWGKLLEYYYGVFFKNNEFDLGYELNHTTESFDQYDYAYLHNISNEYKKEEVKAEDKYLSPLYPWDAEGDFCWRKGYTYNDNPDDIAFVLPLSKIVVPSMISKERGLIYVSDNTMQSIYERTNEFLGTHPSFYQDAIAPLVKTYQKNKNT